MKDLTKRCYAKLSKNESIKSLIPEVVKYVEDQCYVFSLPFLLSYGFEKSDVFSEIKDNRILKMCFVEACMKADVSASVLFDYARSMFGDNDLLFYIYVLGTDFQFTSIYRTYFKTDKSPECRVMFIIKLILRILLIILVVIMIVLIVKRFDHIKHIFM